MERKTKFQTLAFWKSLTSCCLFLNGHPLPTSPGHLGTTTRASQCVRCRGQYCFLSIHIPWVPNSCRFKVVKGMDFSQVWRGALHCSKFHKRFKSFRLKPEAWLTDSFHIPSSSRSPDFSSGPDNSLVKK